MTTNNSGLRWTTFNGALEATFGSASLGFELSRYETSFALGVNGLETSGSVFSGACRIYELAAVNRSGSTVYAQLFDMTGSPGAGMRPIYSFPVLSSSEKDFSWRLGRPLNFGLQVAFSTDYSTLTASNSAGAFYIEYKV